MYFGGILCMGFARPAQPTAMTRVFGWPEKDVWLVGFLSFFSGQ